MSMGFGEMKKGLAMRTIRWLANATLRSPHDETYLVRISLPSLVACRR